MSTRTARSRFKRIKERERQAALRALAELNEDNPMPVTRTPGSIMFMQDGQLKMRHADGSIVVIGGANRKPVK